MSEDGIPPTPDSTINPPDTTKDHSTDSSIKGKPREEREISEKYSFEENLQQVVTIVGKDSVTKTVEKPGKGEKANKMINTINLNPIKKTASTTTVRPVGTSASGSQEEPQKVQEYKEPYLPLYSCDEVMSPTVDLEDLYRGCIRGCQLKEPVHVTKIKMQSPKAFSTKMDVIRYSAVQITDTCHEDLVSNEHRVKSAVEYPLSEDEIATIYKDVSPLLKYDTDIIHGDYPKAECSYWQDTQAKSVMTRVKMAKYDMFFAPELDEYYIHIPTEQVNVLQWDGGYSGQTGIYRWKHQLGLEIPCLLKTGDEIVCLGRHSAGEDLHCATAGLLLEAPYIDSWNGGCHSRTTKDVRGVRFEVVEETTMSYSEAMKDKNPNIQSLSSAMTHLEEVVCTAGCGELTMMTMANNTNAIVDTPVGIWKRKSMHGNTAIQCSTMAAGSVVLLAPTCTMLGVVGVKHISSADLTYNWDMTQIHATTAPHPCLTMEKADIQSLIQYQSNGTMSIDTFAGRVELNLKTGDSRFLYYNERIVLNKKRWFPSVELEQEEAGDQTEELEIAMMQQMRNLSAEYAVSCEESRGPIALQNIGGTIWMLEEDIMSFWERIWSFFWLWKVILGVLIAWAIIYVCILSAGLLRALFGFKRATKMTMKYKRPSSRATEM